MKFFGGMMVGGQGKGKMGRREEEVSSFFGRTKRSSFGALAEGNIFAWELSGESRDLQALRSCATGDKNRLKSDWTRESDAPTTRRTNPFLRSFFRRSYHGLFFSVVRIGLPLLGPNLDTRS